MTTTPKLLRSIISPPHSLIVSLHVPHFVVFENLELRLVRPSKRLHPNTEWPILSFCK